jgi:hypothetical protein
MNNIRDEHLTMAEENLAFESNPAHDDISLNEKNIEPDPRIIGNLGTRNLQLGNINPKMFARLQNNLEIANKFISIPDEYGGFLSSEIGYEMIQATEITLLLSNSLDGFLRKNNQSKKVQIEKSLQGYKKWHDRGVITQ